MERRLPVVISCSITPSEEIGPGIDVAPFDSPATCGIVPSTTPCRSSSRSSRARTPARTVTILAGPSEDLTRPPAVTMTLPGSSRDARSRARRRTRRPSQRHRLMARSRAARGNLPVERRTDEPIVGKWTPSAFDRVDVTMGWLRRRPRAPRAGSVRYVGPPPSRPEDLERDLAPERPIERPIHLSHAPGAEQPEDFVMTEPYAGRERQARVVIVNGRRITSRHSSCARAAMFPIHVIEVLRGLIIPPLAGEILAISGDTLGNMKNRPFTRRRGLDCLRGWWPRVRPISRTPSISPQAIDPGLSGNYGRGDRCESRRQATSSPSRAG